MDCSTLLSKEKFWNEIEQKYSAQFNHFAAWIDEYKKKVDWEKLFNGDIGYEDTRRNGFGHTITVAPKFHQLPDAMQIGIFIQYVIESGSRYQFSPYSLNTIEAWVDELKEWFCEQEEFLSKKDKTDNYDYEGFNEIMQDSL